MICYRSAALVLVLSASHALAAAPDSSPNTSDEIPPRKPNVVMLVVDDMRDWVGCLAGYDGQAHTPHIDRLAKRGMLFSNAHCASPVCAPSRVAVMTGLRPSSTGLYDNNQWWLPHLPDVITMPMHFRRHGYRVVGAGKIYHHTAGNNPPKQWDDFFRLTFRDDPWFRDNKLNYPWTTHAPFPPGYPFSGVPGLGHENDWGSLPIADEEYDDARTADFAIRFLEKSHDNPFFLACGLYRPHLPWYVPKAYFDLYPLDDINLPPVRADDLDDIPEAGRKLAQAKHGEFVAICDAGRWKQAVQAYLASISFADAQLGRVIDALEKSPNADDTIVVLWSDHGWHLGEKGHWHKSTLWEAATRVPLVIRMPGKASGICKRSVGLIDLFPTLSELCGLEPIAVHDGSSLARLLADPAAASDRPAVTEFLRGNAAVRSDRYRYIRYRDGGEELYDHQSDPNEWHNLADRDDFAAIKREHARWLPTNWAKSAPKKDALRFDPHTYTWEHKKTGSRTVGSKKLSGSK